LAWAGAIPAASPAAASAASAAAGRRPAGRTGRTRARNRLGHQEHLIGRLRARKLHAEQLLDIGQEVCAVFAEEAHRLAGVSGAAGTADAVDVVLGPLRQVVIDHQRNIVHVDAAGGHVGGDDDLLGSGPEFLQHLDPLVLRDVAGEHRHVVAEPREIVLQSQVHVLAVAEDDDPLIRFVAEQIKQQCEFLVAQHREEGLLDVFADHVFGFALEHNRVGQPVGGEAEDVVFQRRRKEQRLAVSLFGQLGDDPLHIGDEPHVEHPVRLVDDQHFHFGEVEVAATRIVDDPPRRADHQIDRAGQRPALLLVVHAAEDDDAVEAGEDAERFGVLVNLHRQLAGRGQHQAARLSGLAFAFERIVEETGEGGEKERGGLAGSGLRFSGEVAVFQQRRERQRLDRRAVFESGVLDAVLNLFVQRQVEEAHLPLHRRNVVQRRRMLRLRGFRLIGRLHLNRTVALSAFGEALALGMLGALALRPFGAFRAFRAFALRPVGAFAPGTVRRGGTLFFASGHVPVFVAFLPAVRLFLRRTALLLIFRLFRRFNFHNHFMALVGSEQRFQYFLQFFQHAFTSFPVGAALRGTIAYRRFAVSFR